MLNPIKAKRAYNINIRLNYKREAELGKNSKKKLSKKNPESFSRKLVKSFRYCSFGRDFP